MVFHPKGPARLGDFPTAHFNAGWLPLSLNEGQVGVVMTEGRKDHAFSVSPAQDSCVCY